MPCPVPLSVLQSHGRETRAKISVLEMLEPRERYVTLAGGGVREDFLEEEALDLSFKAWVGI